MGEVPREVLSTTLRVRLSPELAERAVEGLLEHIRRNGIFPAQKVAENVYLIDIPIRGFLRTVREKLILARHVSVARSGTRVVSFNDVDNKLVLTVTISPEAGGTRIHISCSSLSKLRKACNKLAEILSDVLATAEIAAPRAPLAPPAPSPAPPTPTPPREREEKPEVAIAATTPSAAATESGVEGVGAGEEAERKEEAFIGGEERTLELEEALRAEEEVVEEKPAEAPAPLPTPVEEERVTEAPAPPAAPSAPVEIPFNITDKYSEYVNETGLVMLILRGDLIHRTHLAPGTAPREVIERVMKAARENPGKVIVATISSRESPDMAAIAVDSDGNATLSIKEGGGEARITDNYSEFLEFLSKLLEKHTRLAIYRLK